ncbi:TOBE domain-containing protein [Sulfurimonas sp.]|uniref:TOBE domain-containing protein n=1 Tax=Sulfurimonas sp. TaxID=2022749 RepID=UPI0026241505|nr:TOBE domain-containing protein [Sulfurimonas sp.]MDD5156933.1 TOBE domain-containing protein [Sulfurimonas sp.]
MKIDGRFWLTKDGQSFLGLGRIELLERIDKTGSILAAAKEMKMSYKAAWERINGMNALADQPLIERMTGGKGGGGTKLTLYAHELIATFYRLNELHHQFIDRFSEAGDNPEHLAQILSRTFLTTSARNQLPCSLQNIQLNGLYSTLTLSLNGTDTLLSTITTKSVENMGLAVGCTLYAIIKSSDITVVSSQSNLDDTNNILYGTIESINGVEKNREIILRLKGGTQLVALERQPSVCDLKVGSQACAIISPMHIIIGI